MLNRPLNILGLILFPAIASVDIESEVHPVIPMSFTLVVIRVSIELGLTQSIALMIF